MGLLRLFTLADVCTVLNRGARSCTAVCIAACSPSSSSNELDPAAGDPGDLQAMLGNIVAMQATQMARFGPQRHSGRRASSLSTRGGNGLNVLGEEMQGEQVMLMSSTGRASMMLQQMAVRRPSSSSEQGKASAAAGRPNCSGTSGVGPSAAAMTRQYPNTGTPVNCSSGSTTSEDVENSSDDDEEDSSISGLTGRATESACGSTAVGDKVTGVGSDYAAFRPRPQAPVVMEQLEAVLATAHEWQFDAFALADASQGHPLSTLGFYLFHKSGLIEHFGLKPAALARFLRRMEEGYRQNPYHNCTHAADVLQTYNVIIHRGGLMPGYVDPLHLMACYSAAVMHDFEHGGLTNDFLVNSLDSLAVLYNDRRWVGISPFLRGCMCVERARALSRDRGVKDAREEWQAIAAVACATCDSLCCIDSLHDLSVPTRSCKILTAVQCCWECHAACGAKESAA